MVVFDLYFAEVEKIVQAAGTLEAVGVGRLY